MFSNVSVFGKITVVAIVLLIFLGGTGFYAVHTLNEVEQRFEELLSRELEIQQLNGEVKHSIAQSSLSTLEMITAIDPSRQAIFEQELNKHQVRLDELLQQYREQELSVEEQEAFDVFEQVLNGYKFSLNEALKFNKAGEREKAQNAYLSSMGQKTLTNLTLDDLTALSREKSDLLREENRRANAQTRAYVLIVLVLAIAVSAILSFIIARSLSRRIKVLENSVRQGATGDLTMVVALDGKDELGSLAASFGRMVENLKRVVAEVKEQAGQSAEVAEELRRSISETSQAVESVNLAVQEVADGANEQANGAQKAAELINHINQAVETNNKEINLVNERTEEVLSLIENALIHLDNQNRRMQDNIQASAKVAEAVHNLNTMAQEIGQMLETISQIADQTNLLALNAAIEAARAGEQGRGFAVVAEEVRKLAEGSAQAAEEIGRIVEQVQMGTKEAVREMDIAQTTIKAQEEAVNHTDAIFRQISQAVREVSHSVEGVANAEKQIVDQTHGITDVINRVAALAEEDAAAAQEVSASSEEQAAAMEELNYLAESMAQMGQKLMEVIAGFKLEEETPSEKEEAPVSTGEAEEKPEDGTDENLQEG